MADRRDYCIREIATIYTDFPEKFGIPRQSGLVEGLKGRIVFQPEYRTPDAVRGMEEYSHLWLVWGFSEAKQDTFCATVAPPRLGGRIRKGVFATRSPYRPNSLGLSSVRLERVEIEEHLGPVIYVAGVDMLNGTPIYDIKPYLPYVDCHTQARGSFSDVVKKHVLKVHISEELLHILPEELRKTVVELLEQDPRTAFIHDETRVWGIAYRRWNIRFTVSGEELNVVEITELDTEEQADRTSTVRNTCPETGKGYGKA